MTDVLTERAGVRTGARPCTEVELATRQVQALEAWHQVRRAVQDAAGSGAGSREQRMDLDRRLDVLSAQHAALVACTERALTRTGVPLRTTVPLRAVVGHRNAWFCDRVCGELQRRGVHVVARVDNGAHVVGTVVAEQPELVLVEDRLAMQPGIEVVREVRRYAPWTMVAAQVATEDGVGAMLDAGAGAAYARRVPPVDVAVDLVRLLEERLSA